jgi:hypothetical protein
LAARTRLTGILDGLAGADKAFVGVLRTEAKKTPGVVSPKGPEGAAQKRHLVSFSPEALGGLDSGGPDGYH